MPANSARIALYSATSLVLLGAEAHAASFLVDALKTLGWDDSMIGTVESDLAARSLALDDLYPTALGPLGAPADGAGEFGELQLDNGLRLGVGELEFEDDETARVSGLIALDFDSFAPPPPEIGALGISYGDIAYHAFRFDADYSGAGSADPFLEVLDARLLTPANSSLTGAGELYVTTDDVTLDVSTAGVGAAGLNLAFGVEGYGDVEVHLFKGGSINLGMLLFDENGAFSGFGSGPRLTDDDSVAFAARLAPTTAVPLPPAAALLAAALGGLGWLRARQRV
jgi:hypothetical protein